MSISGKGVGCPRFTVLQGSIRFGPCTNVSDPVNLQEAVVYVCILYNHFQVLRLHKHNVGMVWHISSCQCLHKSHHCLDCVPGALSKLLLSIHFYHGHALPMNHTDEEHPYMLFQERTLSMSRISASDQSMQCHQQLLEIRNVCPLCTTSAMSVHKHLDPWYCLQSFAWMGFSTKQETSKECCLGLLVSCSTLGSHVILAIPTSVSSIRLTTLLMSCSSLSQSEQMASLM